MRLCNLQQEISVATDAARQKYNETTPVDEKSEVGIAKCHENGG